MAFIYIVMAILSAILLLTQNVYVQSMCFFVLYAVCLLSIDFDIAHPYVWFIPLFTLYTISYPLLHEQGYYAILPNCGYVPSAPKMIPIHWCALCSFIVVVTNKQVRHPKIYNYKFNTSLIESLTLALILILCLQFAAVIQSGLGSKREILDDMSSNLFYRLGKIAIQLLPIFVAILIIDINLKKIKKILWVIVINVAALFELLIVGERSAVIQIVVVELLAYNIAVKKINLKKAFIAAALILLAIILGVGMKASFRNGQDFSLLLSEEPLWVKLFNAEFSSASVNTTNILNHQKLWEYGYGIKYLLLFCLPFNFFPLSKLLSALGYSNLFTIADNSTWYHDAVLTGYRSGYGFSMVADGYMELGLLGVILFYMLLSVILKKAYEKSSYSMSSLIIYIVMVPIFIYSTRATLLYFAMYSVKYIFLPLILLSVLRVHRKNYKLAQQI